MTEVSTLPDTRAEARLLRELAVPWARAVAMPGLLFAAGLVLYVVTLAPTIVWGDDATLQVAAIVGNLQASAGGHPAWVAVAHAATRLPLGEPAYRVNLVSAVWGALTLAITYGILRAFALSRRAATLATAAFAVSHTFWLHAVRPEVYTMTLATSAGLVWAALQWRRTGRTVWLAVVGLAAGLALATHVLVLLYAPALIWLFVMERRQLTRRSVGVLLVAGFVGLLPLAALLARDVQAHGGMTPAALLRWALFTYTGYDFGAEMLRFSAASLRSDALQWALFLSYQFIGLALVLAVVGTVVSWRRLPRRLAIFVVLLYIVPALFAFSYRVGDRFVFFLPSYLAVTVWLGFGVEWLFGAARTQRLSPAAQTVVTGLVLAVLVCAPVVMYRLTPDIMERTGVQFRTGRRVPGPRARYFLLWPPKRGYTDARDFATAALAKMPPDGVMLADPILAAPMQYLHQVEGMRPDVLVRFCCWDLDAALAAYPGRPVALPDLTPEIYPVEHLEQRFEIVPDDPIYVLMPLKVE